MAKEQEAEKNEPAKAPPPPRPPQARDTAEFSADEDDCITIVTPIKDLAPGGRIFLSEDSLKKEDE
jgi:hypothetical protein